MVTLQGAQHTVVKRSGFTEPETTAPPLDAHPPAVVLGDASVILRATSVALEK
jgi:hypothetical protein